MADDSQRPEDRPVEEGRRNRRRRRLMYGGLGGGAMLIVAGIYYFFFSVAVYLTIDDALREVARRNPNARVTRQQPGGYVTTLSNLEASTGAGSAAADSSSINRVAVDFVRRPEITAAF